MDKITVTNYLKELETQKYKHPLYISMHTTLTGNELLLLDKCYLGIVIRLKKYCKKSDKGFSREVLKKVELQLRENVNDYSFELNVLENILNYAYQYHKLDSNRSSRVFKLKPDKPLNTPVDLISFSFSILLFEKIKQEINSPNRNLSDNAIIGRILLICLFLTTISSEQKLLEFIKNSDDLYYAKEFTMWWNKENGEYYILCDVVVSVLMQFRLFIKDNKVLERKVDFLDSLTNRTVKRLIQTYLHEVKLSDGDSLSFTQLLKYKKIYFSQLLSPLLYTYYFSSAASEKLPFITLSRIILCKTLHCQPVSIEVGQIESKNNELSNKFNIMKNIDYMPNGLTVNKVKLKRLIKVFQHLKYKDIKIKKLVLEQLGSVSDCEGFNQTPHLFLLFEWCKHLLTHGGVSNNQRSLRYSTVADYVKSFGLVFLSVFNELDILKLTASDWLQHLESVANKMSSAQRQNYVLYFATFLENYQLVRSFKASDLKRSNYGGRVDANIISLFEADKVLKKLVRGSSSNSVYRHAYLIFCLCFYSGLRRNEAAKLRICDLSLSINAPKTGSFDFINLFVLNHNERQLKTNASRRIIPLDALWPKNCLCELRDYVTIRINEETKRTVNSPLFNQDLLVPAFDLITSLVKEITQDPSFRVHHLRHSCPNWSFFRLQKYRLKVNSPKAEVSQFLEYEEIFHQSYIERYFERTNVAHNSRKLLFQTSSMLGHTKPDVTMKSYLHLSELQHVIELNQLIPLTSRWMTECIGNSKLDDNNRGTNVYERIIFLSNINKADNKKSKKVEANKYKSMRISLKKKIIKISPLENQFIIVNTKIEESAKSEKYNFSDFSMLTWANVFHALLTNKISKVAEHYSIPAELLTVLIENAESISNKFPARGKKLNKVPIFSRSLKSVKGSKTANAEKSKLSFGANVINYLCDEMDNCLKQGKITSSEIRDACEILTYTVVSKSNAIRTPNAQHVRNLLNLLKKLGLKNRHLKFKLYGREMEETKMHEAKGIWSRVIKESGFECDIAISKPSENLYFGSIEPNGYLSIDVLISTKVVKNSRRNSAFFNFFHLLLILTYRENINEKLVATARKKRTSTADVKNQNG